MIRSLIRIAGIAWASPYTLLGMAIGALGLVTGGSVRVRAGAIEFFGGGVRWFVAHLPTGPMTLAITFGHTILGQTEAALDVAGDHERVHVRQYECWGPLMGPAYLLCSLWLFLRGKRAYHDNPFEQEAERLTGGEEFRGE